MNKTELIDVIAESSNLTKAAADRALGATISAITDSLSNNEAVTLIGFGTFGLVHRSVCAAAVRFGLKGS
jgi:nucleoid DNA-binding protein